MLYVRLSDIIIILWHLELLLLLFLAKSKSALARAALSIRRKVYPMPEQTSARDSLKMSCNCKMLTLAFISIFSKIYFIMFCNTLVMFRYFVENTIKTHTRVC